MQVTVFFFLVLLAMSVLASPLPKISNSEVRLRLPRPPRSPQFVKGQKPRVPSPLNLRKGEYICGNKICSLKPGQIPPNCEGVCQYKI